MSPLQSCTAPSVRVSGPASIPVAVTSTTSVGNCKGEGTEQGGGLTAEERAELAELESLCLSAEERELAELEASMRL